MWRALVDTNQDGSINVDELNRLFEAADFNSDGLITADELQSVIEQRLSVRSDSTSEGSVVLAKELIACVDTDGDSAITRKELFDFFGSEEDVKKAIAKAEKVEAEMEYA